MKKFVRIQPAFLLLLLFGASLYVSLSTGVAIDADDPVPDGSSPLSAYDSEALEYFFEIAFGSEYGSTSTVQHKWSRDVKIAVRGSPTPADLATLDDVVAELNRLVRGISLRVGDGAADMEIYFIPESRFASVETNYVPKNYGFFWVWWDREHAINRARILIASEDISQLERSHLIREELTQSMGLFRDSWRYPESVFYQGWTHTTEYAPQDQATISLLYEPALRPGMTREQVEAILIADQ